MLDQDVYLNLAEVCPDTQVLGPGRRYALWVQGCPFQCPGCLALKWRPQRIKHLAAVTALANDFLAVDGLEGLTVSGGEPMLQAAAIRQLIHQVRQHRPDATLIVYTGYTLEELRTQGDDAQRALLNHVDILIDGRYEEALNDNRGLRGSTNQRIHFLTRAYRDLSEDWFIQRPRQVELRFREDALFMVGVPPDGLDSAIKEGVTTR